MSDSATIGVFDSGLGGLTVLSAIHEALPSENTVYLGDTARVPYGGRSPSTIVQFALQNAHALAKKNDLKALVVACNTVSSVAMPALRESLNLPIIGTIEPTVQALTRFPDARSITILATKATVSSGAYERALRQAGFAGDIYAKACPLFVPITEEGITRGPIAEQVVAHYLVGLPKTDIVILGCTHYPTLLPLLERALTPRLGFLHSGKEIASVLKYTLATHGTLKLESTKRGRDRYFVTDSPCRFEQISEFFLGRPVPSAHVEQITVTD
jgi:glutamate racemase